MGALKLKDKELEDQIQKQSAIIKDLMIQAELFVIPGGEYKTFGEKQYFFDGKIRTQSEAKAFCHRLNMTMLTVTSFEKKTSSMKMQFLSILGLETNLELASNGMAMVDVQDCTSGVAGPTHSAMTKCQPFVSGHWAK